MTKLRTAMGLLCTWLWNLLRENFVMVFKLNMPDDRTVSTL